MPASDFGTNVKEGARRYWTEDPSILPEEMASEFREGYGTADMALTGMTIFNIADDSRQTNVHRRALSRSERKEILP
jgi:hypothetical protein